MKDFIFEERTELAIPILLGISSKVTEQFRCFRFFLSHKNYPYWMTEYSTFGTLQAVKFFFVIIINLTSGILKTKSVVYFSPLGGGGVTSHFFLLYTYFQLGDYNLMCFSHPVISHFHIHKSVILFSLNTIRVISEQIGLKLHAYIHTLQCLCFCLCPLYSPLHQGVC